MTIIKKIDLGRMDSCASTFFLHGPDIDIRFWIIVGGIPCVSFGDFSFSRRFTCKHDLYKAKWDPETRTYPHQKRHSADKVYPPPNPGLDLPNGWQDIEDWLRDSMPARERRLERLGQIREIVPSLLIRSKRLHDKNNRCYYWLSLSLHGSFRARVDASSACYAGRADDMDIDEPWRSAIEFFNKRLLEHGPIETIDDETWPIYLAQVKKLNDGQETR